MLLYLRLYLAAVPCCCTVRLYLAAGQAVPRQETIDNPEPPLTASTYPWAFSEDGIGPYIDKLLKPKLKLNLAGRRGECTRVDLLIMAVIYSA